MLHPVASFGSPGRLSPTAPGSLFPLPIQKGGFGIVVPGMVDQRTGRVLNSPQLGWHDVDIREALAAATGDCHGEFRERIGLEGVADGVWQVYFLDLNADEDVYVYGQTSGDFPVTADVYSNPGSGQFIQKFTNGLYAIDFSNYLATKPSAIGNPA